MNYGCDTFLPFVQKCQNRIVYIIVNKNDPPFSFADKICYKGICIIYLPVVENTLDG